MFVHAFRTTLLRPTTFTTTARPIKMASILSSALGKTTEAAHSAFATLAAASQVTVGGNVPAVDVKEKTPDSKLNLATLPGKNVIVTVPAAFSPSCSETVSWTLRQEK